VVERASRRALACLLTTLVTATLVAPGAAAEPSRKKSIWGPVERNGVSQFPLYRQLGVGLLQMSIAWNTAAPTRPADPGDPADPAPTSGRPRSIARSRPALATESRSRCS
jgi:hypothetical protein